MPSFPKTLPAPYFQKIKAMFIMLSAWEDECWRPFSQLTELSKWLMLFRIFRFNDGLFPRQSVMTAPNCMVQLLKADKHIWQSQEVNTSTKLQLYDSETPTIIRSINSFATRGKVLSWEYRSPRKRNSCPSASVILCWVSWECITYLLCVKWFVGLFTLEIGLFTLKKITGLRRFWTVTSTPS